MHLAVFTKRTTHHVGYGGMETQNKLLCEELAKKGYVVEVFAPAWNLKASTLLDEGIQYHFINSDYRYLLSKLNNNSWYAKSLDAFTKLHTRNPFDLVLSQSSAGLSIIDNKTQLNVKVIAISHGTAIGELRTFLMNHHSITDLPKIFMNIQFALRQFFNRQRQFVHGANKVIAVSNAVKQQLIDETFISANKVVVIHNGVLPFELLNSQDPQFGNFIYVGQLTEDKGVKLFTDMAVDARFAGYHLRVVGSGDLENLLKQYSSKSQVGLKIELYGKLDHPNTIAFLGNNSGAVLLFPTRRIEGFPMVLVEAMMAGLAIVAYDLGGVSDAIEDSVNGYLIPAGNANKFKLKALELAQNTAKIKEMSVKNIERSHSEFTLQRMIEKYENLFKDVIQS